MTFPHLFCIFRRKCSPSFFTSTILCPSSFILLGTFCMGSPSSRIISRTWPSSILSSLSLVFTKFMGHRTPLKSNESSAFMSAILSPCCNQFAAREYRFHKLHIAVYAHPINSRTDAPPPLAVYLIPFKGLFYSLWNLFIRDKHSHLICLPGMSAVLSAYPYKMTVFFCLPRFCGACPYTVTAVDALLWIIYRLPCFRMRYNGALFARLAAYSAASACIFLPCWFHHALEAKVHLPCPCAVNGTARE